MYVAISIGQTTAADACPDKCNYIYAPVCGRDQNGDKKTFSNECVFKIENCKYHGRKFLIFDIISDLSIMNLVVF